jgi:hypothetical protein
MKIRLTLERDGRPLYSTIFEVKDGELSVPASSALKELSDRHPDISLLDEGVRVNFERVGE